MAARRTRKLTPEQKKAVWAEPSSNAGAGWGSHGNRSFDDEPRERRDNVCGEPLPVDRYLEKR